MDRRKFTKLLAFSGVSYASLRLVGCGQSLHSSLAADGSAGTGATVMMNDIDVIALYFDGTQGPNTGRLKVSDIIANKPVTLKHWDGDGHTYTITPEHYAKLKRGEQVRIETTFARGHNHIVLVDPKHAAPGSVPTAVPLVAGTAGGSSSTPPPATAGNDDNTVVTDTVVDEDLYALVSDADQPQLYISGAKEFDDLSVQYCLDSQAKCAKDQSLWHAMQAYKPRTDRQILVSKDKLALDASRNAYELQIRGREKKSQSPFAAILKLINKHVGS